MNIFSFAGWSGSGKTLLISRLIKEFKLRKLKVAAVKKTSHSHSLQPEAKDSHRFLQAGADDVFLISKNEWLQMRQIEGEGQGLEILFNHFKDHDIVLLEGIYPEGIPIIEVFDSQRNRTPKFPIEKLAALVSDQKPSLTIPCFGRNEIEKIVEFLERFNEKRDLP